MCLCFAPKVLCFLGRVLFVTGDDVIDDTPTMRFRRLESTTAAEGNDDKERTLGHNSSLAVISEWRQLAVIIDRICFIVFLVSMVIIVGKMAAGK